jgi:hypothetical protein
VPLIPVDKPTVKVTPIRWTPKPKLLKLTAEEIAAKFRRYCTCAAVAIMRLDFFKARLGMTANKRAASPTKAAAALAEHHDKLNRARAILEKMQENERAPTISLT